MQQMAHCERHDWWYRSDEGCLACNEESLEPVWKPASVEDVATNYNAIKEFEGRKYTGMRVGGSHCWYYQQGEWKETKVAPDRWRFTYVVNKRRKWNAPEGSGAPVGTEYHWYILAHQNARKLSANEYTTSMTGTKYKVAHRRAASEEWSASERAQLRQLITILEENIIRLQDELGEAGKELGTMPREAESLVMTIDKRRKEMVGARRMPPKNSFPSITIGQPPLEMYMVSYPLRSALPRSGFSPSGFLDRNQREDSGHA
jgi:hypothetical protein